ncbi:MAG: hypothetical protein FD135_4153, partial [Comamonadaceae bacterium]
GIVENVSNRTVLGQVLHCNIHSRTNLRGFNYLALPAKLFRQMRLPKLASAKVV